MAWMCAEHLGRLEVDKASQDKMKMCPEGLVGGLGLIQRRGQQRRQRINQSVYLINQSPGPPVHKIGLRTYEDNDAIGVLCPTFGHLLILFLRKICIHGEKWIGTMARFHFVLRLSRCWGTLVSVFIYNIGWWI